MLAGAAMDQGEGSAQPTESHPTPVDPLPSTSSPPHSPHQSPPHSPDVATRWVKFIPIKMDKEIVVANKMGASSVSASFRRDVRDRAERQQWDDLSSILNSVVLSSSKDRWTYDLSGDGEFKVKVIRNFIDDLFLP
ncbi:hypothetical protein Tco_0440222, partial [Tanacetum coccineum]